MSNFSIYSPATASLPATAPQLWTAATVDNLATITATGYLNDKVAQVKQGDFFWICYLDDGIGGGTRAVFRVVKVVDDLNLVLWQGAAVSFAVTESIHSGVQAFAGGGVTQTLTDATIVPGSRVFVQARSVTTPSAIVTVLPGTGSAVVTWSIAPGATSVQYSVFN